MDRSKYQKIQAGSDEEHLLSSYKKIASQELTNKMMTMATGKQPGLTFVVRFWLDWVCGYL
jgi:hypothetical protein